MKSEPIQMRYRCAFYRHETEGPERRAPPCARCGRQTVRIVEPVDVIVVSDSKPPHRTRENERA